MHSPAAQHAGISQGPRTHDNTEFFRGAQTMQDRESVVICHNGAWLPVLAILVKHMQCVPMTVLVQELPFAL